MGGGYIPNDMGEKIRYHIYVELTFEIRPFTLYRFLTCEINQKCEIKIRIQTQSVLYQRMRYIIQKWK